MIGRFIMSLYPTASIDRIRKKIYSYGSDYKLDVETFILMRILLSLFIGIIIYIVSNSILITFLSMIVTYILDEYIILDYRFNRRKNTVEEDAIYYFELLAITIDKVGSLKSAIELTSSKINNSISYEFKQMIKNVDNGNSIPDAINMMSKFIPSEVVNSALIALKEGYELDNPINSTLNDIVSFLKDKRIYNIKNEINIFPIKFTLITFIVFLPIIVLLIILPYLVMLVS